MTAKPNAHLAKALRLDPRDHRLRDPFCRTTSRLRVCPDLFQFKLASEFVPDLVRSMGKSLSWEECCAKKAQELLRLDRQFYYLSYSGGIDSSTALAAILQSWPSSDLKRLRIFLSHESIRENPTFFRDHVSKFPLFSSFRDLSNRLVQENALMITGELGDQLFGSDILGTGSRLFGDECLFDDYRTYAPMLMGLAGRRASREAGMPNFLRYEPIAAECPFPIRTTHDFFWWWNFTQKWQYVKYRFAERESWNHAAGYGTHVMHFFDSVEFQNWSLQNHDQKIRASWKNYKFKAKEYLYGFTKDPAQRELLKVQSLKSTYTFTPKRAALDENLHGVRAEELGQHVRF